MQLKKKELGVIGVPLIISAAPNPFAYTNLFWWTIPTDIPGNDLVCRVVSIQASNIWILSSEEMATSDATDSEAATQNNAKNKIFADFFI